MAEYYVVRDKNTGLYFRGKGVNRWGKYYNQASIYRIKANAENTIKEVSWRGEQAEIVPIQIVETTADVVPKSEVEKTIDDLKRYIILNEDISKKCKMENGEQNEEYWKGKLSAFLQIRGYIDAELKKKYTEEK